MEVPRRSLRSHDPGLAMSLPSECRLTHATIDIDRAERGAQTAETNEGPAFQIPSKQTGGGQEPTVRAHAVDLVGGRPSAACAALCSLNRRVKCGLASGPESGEHLQRAHSDTPLPCTSGSET